MAKYKAVVKELPSGTKYDVYQKYFFVWIKVVNFLPLTGCLFLIDDNIKRLKEVYGEENVIIDDRRKK